MIQISFEPAYDPFHAAFRFLRQLRFLGKRTIELRRAKLLDLYLVEPHRCLEIRLQGDLKKAARRAAAMQPPVYGRKPTSQALFARMAPMQDAAIQTMVSRGLVDGDAYQQGVLIETDIPIPEALRRRLDKINEQQRALMSFLFDDLDEVLFDGPKGLKDRTRLGEFRYDLV